MKRFLKKFNSRTILIAVFVCFPLVLLGAIVISEDRSISVNENRVLTTGADITFDVMDGKLQDSLEKYLSDQFPLRDTLKGAEVNLKLTFGSTDIGGAYVGQDGRLFQKLLDSDVDKDKCVRYAARVNRIAEETGIPTVVMYVPSSGIALPGAMPNGAPMYDYDGLYKALQKELKSVQMIDLRKALANEPEYYYTTDHHWTAAGVAQAYHEWRVAHGTVSDSDAPQLMTVSDRFRGTLWSRVPSERIGYEKMQAPKLETELIVTADGKEIGLYDYDALKTKDKYNFFQGGNHGILTVENPAVSNGKVLMILKDSFANSFLPCIVNDYQKIIMIDERYAFIDAGQFAKDGGVTEIAVIREIISVG